MKKLAFTGFLLVTLLLAVIGCTGEETSEPTPTPTPSPTATLSGFTVDISDFAFAPQTLQVPVGTEVTWVNIDPVAHTVSSRDGLFDSGSMSKNDTFSYTFSQSGTYDYYCKFHPYMTGEIVVQ